MATSASNMYCVIGTIFTTQYNAYGCIYVVVDKCLILIWQISKQAYTWCYICSHFIPITDHKTCFCWKPSATWCKAKIACSQVRSYGLKVWLAFAFMRVDVFIRMRVQILQLTNQLCAWRHKSTRKRTCRQCQQHVNHWYILVSNLALQTLASNLAFQVFDTYHLSPMINSPC